MKRDPNYLLRDVAGSLVIVPVGDAVQNFPGMMTLNATGAYLWELLENEQTQQTLVAALLERYAVSRETAEADVEAFVKTLMPTGAIIL